VILETAVLDVIPGQEPDFEKAFRCAERILAAATGYRRHDLKRCLERRNRYLLLVEWECLEDHTVAFRGSAGYREWKALLHRFYDPFPCVEHYEDISR